MSSIDKSTQFGIFSRDAMPEGTKPIENFDLNKYLGKWYDIARMNFKHEGADSTNVYLVYSLREDGMVNVNNNAYLEDKQEWYSRQGKAKFRGPQNIGALDVSFDGIKWAGYNVVAIDGNYEYALVFGRNLDFMWMLSRTKTMPDTIKNKYLEMAKSIGYNTEDLVYTIHNREDD